MDILHSGDIVTYTDDYNEIKMYGIVIGYAKATYHYDSYEDTVKNLDDFAQYNKFIIEQARKPDINKITLSGFNVMVFIIGCTFVNDDNLDVTKAYLKELFKKKLSSYIQSSKYIVLKVSYQLTPTGHNQGNFEQYMIKNAMFSKNIALLNGNVVTGEEIIDTIKSKHSDRSQDLAVIKQFKQTQFFDLGKVYLMKYKQFQQVFYSLLLCVNANIGQVKFLTLKKDISHVTFESDILNVATELHKNIYDTHAYAERCKSNARGKFCSYDEKRNYYVTSLEVKNIGNCIKYWKI